MNAFEEIKILQQQKNQLLTALHLLMQSLESCRPIGPAYLDADITRARNLLTSMGYGREIPRIGPKVQP